MKALEEEKADQVVSIEAIRVEVLEQARQEAVASVVDFRMGFRRSTLFMIKRKYPHLDLTDIDLAKMEGHNVPDPTDGSLQSKAQGDKRDLLSEAEGEMQKKKADCGLLEKVGDDKIVNNIDEFDPSTLNVNVSPKPNIEDSINVSPDVSNDN